MMFRSLLERIRIEAAVATTHIRDGRDLDPIHASVVEFHKKLIFFLR